MSPRRILVADEDTDTRVILRTLLERHSYVVEEATTALEAFTAAQRAEFDLIVMNYPMASPDGESLVLLLRNGRSTRSVPILNLTSRVVPQFLQQAAAEGVTLSLAKPIDIKNIVHVVNDLSSHAIASAS